MNVLSSQKIYCPYCGEKIEILVDCSQLDQTFIEDCQVCCRPINFNVFADHNDEISLTAITENG